MEDAFSQTTLENAQGNIMDEEGNSCRCLTPQEEMECALQQNRDEDDFDCADLDLNKGDIILDEHKFVAEGPLCDIQVQRT